MRGLGNLSATLEPRKQAWDNFAEKDPFTYILTSLKGRNPEEFWRSGEKTVNEELLPFLLTRAVPRSLGMEIGCGVGRLLFPLAMHFDEMCGVDGAQTMVQRAANFAIDKNVRNVRFIAVARPDDLLLDARTLYARVSFIYSLLVFQHVEDFSIIQDYLHAMHFLLAEDGVGYLQFDTRPRTLAYELRSGVPDFLLPRFWRSGIRRIRRRKEDVEQAIAKAGLEILEQINSATEDHRFVVRRSARAVRT
jgi:SAM-dependent methyltransferase